MANTLTYDGDFSVASAIGPKMPSYPFPGDVVSVVYTQDFMIDLESWRPLDLDAPDDINQDCYLVDESQPSHIDGGIVRWVRTYARIPVSRKEYEQFVYTIPGIVDTPTVLQRNIDSYSSGSGITRIICTADHNFDVGDAVIVHYWIKDAKENLYFPREVFRVIVDVPYSTALDVAIIAESNPITRMDTVRPSAAGRKPFQRVVSSLLQTDYFLPGVSVGISNADQIEILQPRWIIDNTGNVTDSYGPTTTPSLTDYRASIAAGELLVAEPSKVMRWMGNIWSRTTRYIKAI